MREISSSLRTLGNFLAFLGFVKTCVGFSSTSFSANKKLWYDLIDEKTLDIIFRESNPDLILLTLSGLMSKPIVLYVFENSNARGSPT